MQQSLFFLFFFLTTNTTVAQESRVFDNLTVDSKILGEQVEYSVYLFGRGIKRKGVD